MEYNHKIIVVPYEDVKNLHFRIIDFDIVDHECENIKDDYHQKWAAGPITYVANYKNENLYLTFYWGAETDLLENCDEEADYKIDYNVEPYENRNFRVETKWKYDLPIDDLEYESASFTDFREFLKEIIKKHEKDRFSK